MFCTNCGTQNNPETKFCVGCGNPLNNQQIPVQAEQVDTQQVVNQQVEQNTYQTQQPNQYESQGYTTQNVVQPQNDVNPVQPKKSNAGKIILIIVAVILILGILSVMAVVNFVKGIFNKVTNSDEVKGIIKTYEEMENIADETMDILETKADELEALDVKSIVENSQVKPIEVRIIDSKLDEATKSIEITAKANNKINKYDELLSESRSPEYYKTFMNQNKKALGFNYNLRFFNLTNENEPLKHIYCFSEEDNYGIDIYENDKVYERWFDITINGGIDGTGKEKVFYKIVKDEFKVDLLNIKEYVDGIKLIEKGDIEELELVISSEEAENTYYTISVVNDGGEYGYLFGYSRKYRIE